MTCSRCVPGIASWCEMESCPANRPGDGFGGAGRTDVLWVVGSSTNEHDPIKMAELLKGEVDKTLAWSCAGLSADVVVAGITAPED